MSLVHLNAGGEPATVEPLALISAEIDHQIATAKRFPRSIERFRNTALSHATLSPEVAAQCVYALPRDGKTVTGPSSRLAEIVVSAFGNCRAAARVVAEGREFISAQGVFFDLESNSAVTVEVQRSIIGKRGRYSPDMIAVTGNAACSIALRNAVFRGVPKALWWDIYQAAEAAAKGDVRTLSDSRNAALVAFARFGVTEAQIIARLGVGGLRDIGLEELGVLRGFLTSIRDGESDPEDIFAPPETAKTRAAAAPAAALPTRPEAQVSTEVKPVSPQAPPATRSEQALAALEEEILSNLTDARTPRSVETLREYFADTIDALPDSQRAYIDGLFATRAAAI